MAAILSCLALVGCDEMKQIIASRDVPTDEEIAAGCRVPIDVYKELEARARASANGSATQIGVCSARKGDDGRVYLVTLQAPEAE